MIGAILTAGNVDFKWDTEFDLGALKADGTLPFGQLPYIEDGDAKMAQGWGCVRYAARKAGLQGDNDAEFALSEMLIEEAHDLYDLMAKAMYAEGDKAAAWADCVEKLKAQYAYLEKLLPGDSPYFKAGDKRLAGGICVACLIDLNVLCLGADLSDWMPSNVPKLTAFFNAMKELPCLKNFESMNPYFKK